MSRTKGHRGAQRHQEYWSKRPFSGWKKGDQFAKIQTHRLERTRAKAALQKEVVTLDQTTEEPPKERKC